jgi:hypothetical protein
MNWRTYPEPLTPAQRRRRLKKTSAAAWKRRENYARQHRSGRAAQLMASLTDRERT